MKPVLHSTGNRRQFLARAAILAGALAVFPRQSLAANKRGLKRALKFTMIQEGKTVLEKMQVAKEAGFEGVEFEIDFAFEHKREILEAAEKTGLLMPGTVAGANGRVFAHPDPKVRAKGIENYQRGLQTTRELGGTSVLLYPGRVDADNPYDVVHERMQESVRAVIPAAEKTGVKIAFENVWNNFLLSPLEARDFVDSFKHPLVGWHFDVGNVVTIGWPEQWIRILGRRIFKLDIKEFSRQRESEEGKRKGFDVQLMEGDCNWPAVMKALDEVGYSGGWGAAEVRGGGKERLRFIADRMEKIFNL